MKFRFFFSVGASLLTSIVFILVSVGYLNLLDFDLSRVSLIKLVGVVTLIILALYFLISCWHKKLRAVNQVVFVNVALFFIFFEIVLKISEDVLPYELVIMLPAEDARRILENHGLITRGNIVGNEMLFSYKPYLEIKSKPWIVIDDNGYRNPDTQPPYDLVILGDSVIIAQESSQDLADFIRKAGLNAVNYGFGGYGPYQYRDAYKAYIIEKGVRHENVIINFCFCNDVGNSISYLNVRRLGGDWRQFLGKTPTKNAFPFNFSPPWSVSIAFNIPFWILQKVRDQSNRIHHQDSVEIKLPRGNIETSDWLIEEEPKFFSDTTWEIVLHPIREIAKLADVAGAKVILGYYPDLAQIYSPFMPKNSPYRLAAEYNHRESSMKLSTLAEELGAEFIDYTGAIQLAHSKQLATVTNLDYHPNLLGVKTMAKEVLPFLNN